MALGPGVRCKPSGGASRIWSMRSTTASLMRSRATVQHLGILRVCLLQTLFPFLDPSQRHAHRLSILLVREVAGTVPSGDADWPALQTILLPSLYLLARHTHHLAI